MSDFKPIDGNITLHGLGFVVVQLPAGQRLHVWHPGLPRRKNLKETWVHNHRFSFESRVLTGSISNIIYRRSGRHDAGGWFNQTSTLYDRYEHGGPRAQTGNRGWNKQEEQAEFCQAWSMVVTAGEKYNMSAYDYHHTEPLGDGKVATLMTKMWEGERPASSLCLEGVEPDTDFDRYQLLPTALWCFVLEVLGGYESKSVGVSLPFAGLV